MRSTNALSKNTDLRDRLQGYGYGGLGTGDAAYSREEEWLEGIGGEGAIPAPDDSETLLDD
ncbi:MAG: hypothetical protein AB7S41_04910 [Parvibaculaceae bacterium]